MSGWLVVQNAAAHISVVIAARRNDHIKPLVNSLHCMATSQ